MSSRNGAVTFFRCKKMRSSHRISTYTKSTSPAQNPIESSGLLGDGRHRRQPVTLDQLMTWNMSSGAVGSRTPKEELFSCRVRIDEDARGEVFQFCSRHGRWRACYAIGCNNTSRTVAYAGSYARLSAVINCLEEGLVRTQWSPSECFRPRRCHSRNKSAARLKALHGWAAGDDFN